LDIHASLGSDQLHLETLEITLDLPRGPPLSFGEDRLWSNLESALSEPRYARLDLFKVLAKERLDSGMRMSSAQMHVIKQMLIQMPSLRQSHKFQLWWLGKRVSTELL